MTEPRDTALRKRALKRDEYTCQNCGKTNGELEAHHVVPISNGGRDRLSNIVTLCEECHKAAHGSKEIEVSRENSKHMSIEIPDGEKLCARCMLTTVQMDKSQCPKCHSKEFYVGRRHVM
jgi:5-methylcytosine-specific restriction endonuclease McrA